VVRVLLRRARGWYRSERRRGAFLPSCAAGVEPAAVMQIVLECVCNRRSSRIKAAPAAGPDVLHSGSGSRSSGSVLHPMVSGLFMAWPLPGPHGDAQRDRGRRSCACVQIGDACEHLFARPNAMALPDRDHAISSAVSALADASTTITNAAMLAQRVDGARQTVFAVASRFALGSSSTP